MSLSDDFRVNFVRHEIKAILTSLKTRLVVAAAERAGRPNALRIVFGAKAADSAVSLTAPRCQVDQREAAGGPDPPKTKVGVSFLKRAATIERWRGTRMVGPDCMAMPPSIPHDHTETAKHVSGGKSWLGARGSMPARLK